VAERPGGGGETAVAQTTVRSRVRIQPKTFETVGPPHSGGPAGLIPARTAGVESFFNNSLFRQQPRMGESSPWGRLSSLPVKGC